MGVFLLALTLLTTPQQVTPQDRAYLIHLAKDTWHSIATLGDSKTGLPYDNSAHGEFTSVSNIGFYLSSIVAAHHMGFISEKEANRKLDKTLTSLEHLKTWFGFQQSWNSVENLQPSKSDTWISVLDSANLAASLITVAGASPNHRERCLQLFHAMDWDHFYDPAQKALIGGYNTETSQLNLKWHLDLLASDAHLAQFFAVAAGHTPESLWDTFNRSTESREGETFFAPGWQGGGLFMQYISSIWLNQKGTIMGNSARSFAAAQIKYAKTIKSPVWGWSASDNPAGGYLGWGALKDEVVTPHASVLPIAYFPEDSLHNLRALEKLGARSKVDGFYDALNWKTRQHSKVFLVLDQGMLFLSLANYLDHDIIHHWFQDSGVVRDGRRRIAVYATSEK